MPFSGTYIGGIQGAGSFASYNQAAGHCIVVFLEMNNSTAGVPSVSDTAGNTYTPLIAGQGLLIGNNYFLNAWYVKNCLGNASNVIAMNGNGAGTFSVAYAYDVSGADLVNPVDVFQDAMGNSAAPSAGSFSTLTANEFIILFASVFGGSVTLTQPSGYNFHQFIVIVPQTAVADLTVSTIQSGINPTWTLSPSQGWGALVVTVRAPASTATNSLMLMGVGT